MVFLIHIFRQVQYLDYIIYTLLQLAFPKQKLTKGQIQYNPILQLWNIIDCDFQSLLFKNNQMSNFIFLTQNILSKTIEKYPCIRFFFISQVYEFFSNCVGGSFGHLTGLLILVFIQSSDQSANSYVFQVVFHAYLLEY